MERLSKKSDRPFVKKTTLALVMLACMLAMALVPAAISDVAVADTPEDANWDYTLDGNNKATLTKYKGTATALVIPRTVSSSNYVVTTLGVLENTENLANVTSIVFQENSQVDTIAAGAFSNFKNVTIITLPDSIRTIGITSEASGGDVAINPFNCPKLEQIQFDRYNPSFKAYDGVLYKVTDASKSECELIVCPMNRASISFPTDFKVTSIGESAFEGCKITSIDIPSTVTDINERSFYKCSSLKTVSGGSGVVSLDDQAFDSCWNLQTFAPANIETIGAKAFCGCSKLTAITTDDVKTIGDEAFLSCSSLSAFKVGGKLESIGECVFSLCENLNSFQGSSDKYYVQTDGILYSKLIDGKKDLVRCPANMSGNVTVADGTTRLAGGSFSSCKTVTSIELPESVTEIGKDSFTYCEKLEFLIFWSSSLKIDESGMGTFAKAVQPYTITQIRGLVEPTVVGADKLDKGAAFDLMYRIGSNVYTYTMDSSPNYDQYILVHGTGDKKIDFTTYEKPWEGAETVTTSDDGPWASRALNIMHLYVSGGVLNIPDSMFIGFNALMTVDGFNEAKTVGSNAFYQCVSLGGIDLSAAESIGSEAFKGCFNLEYVTLNKLKDVTETPALGESAFEGCNDLKSITLPSAVTTVPEKAFYVCAMMTSATMPGVKTIGDDAFAGCKNLKSVSFASNTKIGVNAFGKSADPYNVWACEKLDMITAENISIIGSSAFIGATALKSINLTGLTTTGEYSIDDWAFEGCTGLQYVTVKAAAANILYDAFEGCTGLLGFAVSGTGSYSVDASKALVKTETANSKTTVTLVCYPKGLPATVYALGDNVTAIGKQAFKDSNNLEEITVGVKVSLIASQAFMDCDNLSRILVWGLTGINDVVEGTTVHTVIEGSDKAQIYTTTTEAYNHFLDGGVADEKITLMWQAGAKLFAYEDNATKTLHILGTGEMYAFTEDWVAWDDIEHIVMPEGMTTIGDYAFHKCMLREVTLSENITEIGDYAFANCSVFFSKVVLNSKLETIGDYAFTQCGGIYEISIPSTVTEIGDCAFFNCFNLKKVTFEGTPTLKTIGDRSFEKTNLTKFTIPASLETMGDNPFAQIGVDPYVKASVSFDLENLSKNFVIADNILYDSEKTRAICCFDKDINIRLALPSTVKGVDGYAFDGCINLKSVTFPSEGFESIGMGAFRYCKSIPEVVLYEGLKIISNCAFEYCEDLEVIKLPKSLEYIGTMAFGYCSNVQFGIIKCGDMKQGYVKSDSFYGITLTKLYATEDFKKEASAFSTMSDLYVCGESVFAYVYSPSGNQELHIIGSGNMDDKSVWAWNNTSVINKVVIGPGVTGLGTNVFKGMSTLNNVVIPENITAIPDFAFFGCTGLTNIILNDKVTSIGMWAFSGSGLTGSVTFDGVTTNLAIPASVTSIGFNAFFGCAALAKIILNCHATVGDTAFPGNYSAMIGVDGKTKDGLFTYDSTTKIWADKSCTVTWIVNEEVVQTDKVNTGDPVPEFKGETPTKAADKQYTYQFTNWSPVKTIIDKDTAFTAMFLSTLQKYDVTYANKTTGETCTMKLEYGQHSLEDNMLTVPKDKVFVGWEVGGVVKSAKTQITVESNVTVYAVWGDNFTITYDPGLHGTGSIASVKTSGTLTLPGAKEYTAEAGWQFLGWNVDGTVCKAGATVKVTKTQTVTALWEGINTVTYKAGEHGIGSDYVERFPFSVTFADSQFQPDSEKYYFIGWSVGGAFYEPGDTLSSANSLIAVAQWVAKATVTYDANGGTGSMADAYVVQGKTHTLRENTYTAPYTYAFKEWNVNGTAYKPGQAIVVNEDTVVKAVWVPGVQIHFDANGGTGIMDDVYVLDGTMYMPPECAFYAPENKYFVFWTYSDNIIENPIPIYGYTEFKAIWADKIPVTIDPNGGSGWTEVEYVVNSYTLGTPDDYWFSAPEGTEFHAWSVDGTEYQPGETITVVDATTVKAVWKPYYYVTLDANNGTGATKQTKVTTVTYTVPACEFPAPAGAPKVFKYWTHEDGAIVNVGDKIVMTKDIVLKAYWIPAYTVSFAANGGIGTMDSVAASGDYVLPECGFTPATAQTVFKAWLLPDGTTEFPGATINVAGNMTITATWIVAHEVKVSGNSYGTASADVQYAMAGTVVNLTKTPYAGCDFVKWTVVPESVSIKNDSFVMPDVDVTVKAIFEVHVDTEISATTSFGSVTIPIDKDITSSCWIDLAMYKITSPAQSNIPKDAVVYSIDVAVYDVNTPVSLEGKTVTVFIAYKLALGEDASTLKVYYVSSDGKVVEDMNAKYDAAKGGLVFTTTHFSDYAISHEEIKPAPMDYMPVIIATIIAVVIVMLVMVFVYRYKVNNSSI